MAALARRFNLYLVNISGKGPAIESVKYNITLGNDATGIPDLSRSDWGGANPTETDFKQAAQALDEILEFCDQHNIKGFHHAHLGTMIETVEDAEQFMSAAPKLWLLFDTGHLLAAGSDPMQVFDRSKLRNRIGHVHLKDFHADDPQSWNHRTQKFWEQGRFAELGAGNFGLNVEAVLSALTEIGYEGWVSAELDRPYPTRPPAEAAKVNREYLASLGY